MFDFIITIICLLSLSFFQGSEMAFLYSFKYREKSKRRLSFLDSLIYNLYASAGLLLLSVRLISFILLIIGIFFANICLNTAFPIAQSLPLDFIIKLLFIFICFGTIGFLLPRIFGAKYADKVLYFTTFPLYLASIPLIPLTKFFIFIPTKILHLFKIKTDQNFLLKISGTRGITKKGVKPTSISIIEEQPIRENEMKIFRNALDFSKVRVRDCIVPRTEIIAVESSCSLQELMDSFTKSGKTKIIVYNEDLDHIIGYIHSSEMFRQQLKTSWKEHISDIPVVPESMSAQKMMQIFMKEKKSLAVVADEFGGTTGIISLEDLVEEIFGDIEDEHDTITYIAKQVSTDEYILSARLEIEKVNETFNLDLPSSDEYLTIGGLILFNYEDFPKINQSVSIGPYDFKILKTSKSKIDLVRLKVNTSEKK